MHPKTWSHKTFGFIPVYASVGVVVTEQEEETL